MNTKTEGALAVIAALIVLFSAMWDPRISVAVSIIALLGFGIFRLMQKNKWATKNKHKESIYEIHQT